MPDCASSTGLPWRDQRARAALSAARERPRQGRRDLGPPAPDHRPATATARREDPVHPHRPSLRSQAHALIAADFFEAATLSGARLYVLAIIEHATRRVRILGATAHPTAAWVTQTARNLAMDIHDAGCQTKYLLRDRDGKYPALFDTILTDTGIAVVLTGVPVPRMNSIMERWIQTCRHELLDRTLIWNQAHLLHALREYERHYNLHRPHRGIANARPLRPLPQPTTDPATIADLRIHRHDRLSGLIHEYEHAARTGRTRFSAPAGMLAQVGAPPGAPQTTAPRRPVCWSCPLRCRFLRRAVTTGVRSRNQTLADQRRLACGRGQIGMHHLANATSTATLMRLLDDRFTMTGAESHCSRLTRRGPTVWVTAAGTAHLRPGLEPTSPDCTAADQ